LPRTDTDPALPSQNHFQSGKLNSIFCSLFENSTAKELFELTDISFAKVRKNKSGTLLVGGPRTCTDYKIIEIRVGAKSHEMSHTSYM